MSRELFGIDRRSKRQIWPLLNPQASDRYTAFALPRPNFTMPNSSRVDRVRERNRPVCGLELLKPELHILQTLRRYGAHTDLASLDGPGNCGTCPHVAGWPTHESLPTKVVAMRLYRTVRAVQHKAWKLKASKIIGDRD
jgi:hypothetical protein